MDPINGLAVQLAKDIFQTDQKAKKKKNEISQPIFSP